LPLVLLVVTSTSHAEEGQWQPYQVPQLKAELKRIGIIIPAEKLADLTKHPMSAIVSLGGAVDQARWRAALQRYQTRAASEHPPGLDALLPSADELALLYQHSQLGDTAKRLSWLEQDADRIARADDAFLQLAVKLNDIAMSLENRRKEIDGNLERLIRDPVLGTVPVNFLSSADTTGGNSGSAVMNKRGQPVGLNFDSTYESVTKDWYFDTAITRAIHVDIRYMLWVMKEVDHADNLLAEMTIKYPRKVAN